MLPHHAAWLVANPHRSAEWLAERTRDGFDVHHLDWDHSNNDPANLALVEHGDHLMLHGGRRTLGRMTKPETPERKKRARSARERPLLVSTITHADFTSGLQGLAISKRQLAGELGVNLQTVNDWCLGKTPVPVCVVYVLFLLRERSKIRASLGEAMPAAGIEQRDVAAFPERAESPLMAAPGACRSCDRRRELLKDAKRRARQRKEGAS